MNVELVQGAGAELGEGPVWDSRAGELLWVDITPGVVHRLDPVSDNDRAVPVGQPVGAVCLRSGGGYVVALRDGISALTDAGELTLIADVEADVPANRFNDAKCDPAGRLWAGTVRSDDQPGGTLYRIDPDHSVSPVLADLGLSNGLGWSPDGALMYFIDSLASGLDVFDFDVGTGGLSGRRRLVTVATGEGSADGMTVDSEGFVWIAVYGGGAIRRYSPSGELALVVELPVGQPTSCTFGGPDLRDLYITSARQHMSASQLAAEPLSGGLFRCRPGPVGLPAHAFAG